jgi:hypothetical protein
MTSNLPPGEAGPQGWEHASRDGQRHRPPEGGLGCPGRLYSGRGYPCAGHPVRLVGFGLTSSPQLIAKIDRQDGDPEPFDDDPDAWGHGQAGVVTNRSSIPGDTNGAWYTSGIRLGIPALTSLGLSSDELDEVADVIVTALRATTPATSAAKTK